MTKPYSEDLRARGGRCQCGSELPRGGTAVQYRGEQRHRGVAAPWVFDGPPQPLATVAPPINGAKFLAYVEQVLVPALSPGEIVMMDNPGSHKRAGVRKAIEAAAAAGCFLPACSPDLDPIDPSASSGGLRKAQEYTPQNGTPKRRCTLGCNRICSRWLFSPRESWLGKSEQPG